MHISTQQTQTLPEAWLSEKNVNQTGTQGHQSKKSERKKTTGGLNHTAMDGIG